jgi:outer membrane protein insertion porin family
MKNIFLVIFFFIIFINNSYTEESFYSVSQIKFQGLQRVDERILLKSVDLKTGNLASTTIGKAIKNIFGTGYFDQVKAVMDGETLIFELQEKPVVRRILVKGNEEVSDTSLSEVLHFDGLRFFTKEKAENLTDEVTKLYQTKGYYDAKINYSLVEQANNQVDIEFSINEGKEFTILKVRLNGLTENEEDEVRDILNTKRYKWWSSWIFGTGRVSDSVLEQDTLMVQQYLIDNGYLNGSVKEPKIKKKEDGIDIVFNLNKGDKYTVGNVTFSGDLLYSKAELTEGLKTEAGEIVSGSKVREDTFTLSEKYGDKSYAFANIVPKTYLNPAKKTVNIDFEISKGEPVTVDKIIIKGNEKTYQNVIRRDMKIDEQGFYSTSKIKRSEELIKRLGLFEEVSIRTEPNDEPDKVDLVVNVKEAPSGSFSAGAGYSTQDGVIFNTSLTERNLFGSGNTLSATFDIGSRRNDIILNFQNPRVNDSYLYWGLDVQKTSREFTNFNRNTQGGGTEFGYPLDQIFGESLQDINVFTRYDYDQVDISNVNAQNAADLVVASQGNTTVSSFTPTIQRNTIDNPFDPTKGSRQRISYEYAGLGGDQEFGLLQLSNQWFTPAFEISELPVVFSVRTRLGYGDSFNDDVFPLFRRFFPGGINSVRGFRNRTLGPIDARGFEFGGSKEFVNNVELIFPLVSAAGLKGVVFYDVGEAFDDNQSIQLGKLRKAYGAGFRWSSPLGPIRVEFGYPADRKDGEDGMQTLFSFGSPIY